MRDGVQSRSQPSDWNFNEEMRPVQVPVPEARQESVRRVQRLEDQNGLEVLRVVMDKADKIPENAEFIWNIAMTNISHEKDGRLILCRMSMSRGSFT